MELRKELIEFISWVEDGYNLKENADKIVDEYLKEKEFVFPHDLDKL